MLAVDEGKSFNPMVTLAVPSNVLKSGKNLLIAKKNSPIPSDVCIAKSYDCTKEVKAVDVDSLAIRATIENTSLNGLTEKELTVSLGSIEVLANQLANRRKADLLICNILAPVIKQLAAEFAGVTSLESRLYLTGLLVDQVDDITNLFVSLNWKFLSLNRLDKWALIELCRNPQERLQ